MGGRLFALYLLLLLLAACASAPAGEDQARFATSVMLGPATTETKPPTASPFATKETGTLTTTRSPVPQTPTMLGTQLPSPMPTKTLRPTATITKTATFEPIIRTRVPSLEINEARLLAADLLQTNGGCNLPCWWGLVPGKTEWKEAEDFLAPMAFVFFINELEDITYADVKIPVPAEIHERGYILQDYSIVNGRIRDITIHETGELPAFDFSQILRDYGMPEGIWLRTFSTAFRGDLPIEITLFYPQQGILATYSEFEAQIIGGNVTTCTLLKQSNPILSLWSPENDMTFEETIKLFNRYVKDMPFLPLDEATGISVQDFYEFHSKPNANPCIKTPADLWPEQY